MRVDLEILRVLSRAQTIGERLVLPHQLDRRLYERTNKVLEAAGGRWNRSAKAHVFAADASNRIDQILISGEVELPRDEFNFFPSPPPVVERLIELAGIRPDMRVLEPSAGQGAIAIACAEVGGVVDCFELMAANYAVLAADERLNSVRQGDFLQQVPEAIYDRIVMNPPFARQADVDHVAHALGFLAPGGRVVAVMSAGVTFRDNKKTQALRDLLRERGGDLEALPDGAFKVSGTMVSTVIATIPAAT